MILEVTAKPDTYVICRFVFQEFNPNQVLSIPSVLGEKLNLADSHLANCQSSKMKLTVSHLVTPSILRRFSVSFAAAVAFFAVVLAN